MNVHIKYFFLAALMASALLSSCEDKNFGGQPSKNQHYLGASQSMILLAGFDTEEITITAADATPWRFENYDATWLTISPSSGIGNATVTVHATANQTKEERTTTASLVSTDSEYNYPTLIKITQPSMVVTGLCIDNNHPHTVDMGNGLKWACCNIGAVSPVVYGDYFAWGETSTKSSYNEDNYKYGYDDLTKYCISFSHGTVDNKTQLELSDDAAHVNWGDTWRMPTSDEFRTLFNKCSWAWTIINGVNGIKVTASNGNMLFFPAAGENGKVYQDPRQQHCYYWSSSLDTSYSRYAITMSGLYGSADFGYYLTKDVRYNGLSVRPVTE